MFNLFGGKVRKGPSNVTNRIISLSSEGRSQGDIIDILRKEGFSPEQVDKGMREAMKIQTTQEAESAQVQQPLPSEPMPLEQLPQRPKQPQPKPLPQPTQKLETVKATPPPKPTPPTHEPLEQPQPSISPPSEYPPKDVADIELPEVHKMTPEVTPPPKPITDKTKYAPAGFEDSGAPEPPFDSSQFPQKTRRKSLGMMFDEPEEIEDIEEPEETEAEIKEPEIGKARPEKPEVERYKPDDLDEMEFPKAPSQEIGEPSEPDLEPHGPEEPEKARPVRPIRPNIPIDEDLEEDFEPDEFHRLPEEELEEEEIRPVRKRPTRITPRKESVSPPRPRTGALKHARETENVEEMVESVVEERWEDFRRDLEILTDEVREMDDKLADIQRALSAGIPGAAAGGSAETRQALESYSRSIEDLSSRIDAVEKVLKDSLKPVLESIRSLSDAITRLREKKGL